MKIISFSENKNIEKRVAITPEIAKKYSSIGLEVSVPQNYAHHLGFTDDEYKSQGVNIVKNEDELIIDSNLIVQLGLPSDDKLAQLKENQNLIGVLNPYENKEKINNLVKKKYKYFFT